MATLTFYASRPLALLDAFTYQPILLSSEVQRNYGSEIAFKSLFQNYSKTYYFIVHEGLPQSTSSFTLFLEILYPYIAFVVILHNIVVTLLCNLQFFCSQITWLNGCAATRKSCYLLQNSPNQFSFSNFGFQKVLQIMLRKIQLRFKNNFYDLFFSKF